MEGIVALFGLHLTWGVFPPASRDKTRTERSPPGGIVSKNMKDWGIYIPGFFGIHDENVVRLELWPQNTGTGMEPEPSSLIPKSHLRLCMDHYYDGGPVTPEFTQGSVF